MNLVIKDTVALAGTNGSPRLLIRIIASDDDVVTLALSREDFNQQHPEKRKVEKGKW